MYRSLPLHYRGGVLRLEARYAVLYDLYGALPPKRVTINVY